MRYHYEKPKFTTGMYGEVYSCGHPLYDRCTLFLIGEMGLAVIQQRFDTERKATTWTEIDPWLTDAIYLSVGFKAFFDERGGPSVECLYPTVTVRQIMWALKMKPLKKERWETVFDRRWI